MIEWWTDLLHHSVVTKTKGIMSEFKFECPQCKQHLQCDEQFSGREIQCPGCNHLIRIPPVPGQTAQYAPESGKTWNTFVPPGNAPPAK
jgi:DNA-directed RNA polymerase subunit RPC12/RpoP